MSNNFGGSRLIPFISKKHLDKEAEKFLGTFCPEALEYPMPVPILDIATKRMGLTVKNDCHLSEDLSVLGEMCFSSGVVDIYYPKSDEFKEVRVEQGTMLIDVDVIKKRNIGCFNLTVAHECVHWYTHKKYHDYHNYLDSIIHVHSNSKSPFRAHTSALNNNFSTSRSNRSDEEWMEWQANNISPRILMPRRTYPTVLNKFRNQVEQEYGPRGSFSYAFWGQKKTIEYVSGFFGVSKRAAEIRAQELGLTI